jgi:topoisomerase-4 subunit A
MLDVSNYDKGNGRLRCRAKIEEANEKTIVIRDVPYTTTTTSLVESIEKAIRAGKLKILTINDYTAEEVEIEIKLPRSIYAQDTIRALYAFTDCEVSISPNFTVISGNQPVILDVDTVLRRNTEKLVNDLEKELKIELGRLLEKLHAHLLEQIFIEERLYKEIEECTTYELVVSTIDRSLVPFAELLVRGVSQEDIERLLEIRIKRISRYDIDKKNKEIKEVKGKIKQVKIHLENMVKFTLNYIDSLLDRFGKDYPRQTELTTFSEVVVRKVAMSNLTCGYDPKTGFLGYQVKGQDENSFACSEYDKFLLISREGSYKVINGIDKLFVGQDLVYVGKVDENLIFNTIYRDGNDNFSYVKRFAMPKFILDKEYHLFPAHKNSRIQFLALGLESRTRVYFVPAPRARFNSVEIIFNDYLVKGVAAKGKRCGTRVVRRIVPLADKEIDQESLQQDLPGMAGMTPGPQINEPPTEVGGPDDKS